MKNFITLIKARLAAISAERFVTFITPIVTPLIGILSVWLVKHFPGVPYFGQTQLLVAFGLGAAAAWGALQHWLKGSREHQDRIEKARIDASGGRVDPALAASYDVHPADAVPDLDDLDSAKAKEREAELTRKHEGA